MWNRRTSTPHRRGQMRLVAAAGLACLLLVPNLARAQAIGGAVRDTTGSVVPGVTVEARSPALIERVRTTVSDGNGQYLIVALAPGVYTVTYTLAGFRTVVREGIELSSGFTANVDVELPVGTVAETVTVTEAAPLIDVQNVVRSTSINRDVLEVLPTTRGWDAMALFIPALTVEVGYSTTVAADSAGLSRRGSTRLVSHGSLPQDAMVEIDGFDVNSSVVKGTPLSCPSTRPFRSTSMTTRRTRPRSRRGACG